MRDGNIVKGKVSGGEADVLVIKIEKLQGYSVYSKLH